MIRLNLHLILGLGLVTWISPSWAQNFSKKFSSGYDALFSARYSGRCDGACASAPKHSRARLKLDASGRHGSEQYRC